MSAKSLMVFIGVIALIVQIMALIFTIKWLQTWNDHLMPHVNRYKYMLQWKILISFIGSLLMALFSEGRVEDIDLRNPNWYYGSKYRVFWSITMIIYGILNGLLASRAHSKVILWICMVIEIIYLMIFSAIFVSLIVGIVYLLP